MTTFFMQNKLTIPKDESCAKVLPKLIKDAYQTHANSLDYEFKNISNNHFSYGLPSNIKFKFGKDWHEFEGTRFAMHQLCRKIGMPITFFEKLRGSRDEALNNMCVSNINGLLEHYNGDMLVRTVGGCMRGVLSTRYRAFDSYKILDVFADFVDNNKVWAADNIAIRGFCNSMDVLHLRFTTLEPVKGLEDKDLYYGMEITSSDVGKYALQVRFFIYKQICTNGMCIGSFDRELYTQRHVGITPERFREGLAACLNSFPKLTEEVTAIISSAGRRSLANSPLFNFNLYKDENEPIRKALRNYLGLSDAAMLQIASIARQNYAPTLWGYGNAITEYAQTCNLERRKELETMAGKLMTNFDYLLKYAA